eukprot:768604-Hanusia_phi.AAC.5
MEPEGPVWWGEGEGEQVREDKSEESRQLLLCRKFQVPWPVALPGFTMHPPVPHRQLPHSGDSLVHDMPEKLSQKAPHSPPTLLLTRDLRSSSGRSQPV